MIRRPPRSTLFPYRRSSDLENWQWLPSGGIDFRDIWAMAVHPTRANEIYVGTLPAAVYVSENGGRSFRELDRKSTRLNSSHLVISYAVFCLKKKIETANIHC